MAKNTSILLGDHFDAFISAQVKSGKYASASEVIRAALRVLELEEAKRARLIDALVDGEESGFVSGFDRAAFVNELHTKYRKE